MLTFVGGIATRGGLDRQWGQRVGRANCVKWRMSGRETCPSSKVLKRLIDERRYRMNASSCQLLNSDGEAGADSSFVLEEEGFVGVADTGVRDPAQLYGENLSRRVQFENRGVVDDIVRTIFFRRPEERYLNITSYLEHALQLVTFPNCASACLLSLEDQKLRAAWVGSAGFVLIRGDEVRFRSRPRTMERLERSFRAEIDASRGEADQPRLRQMVLDVEEDDLIVLATDGLWDNITEAQTQSSLIAHLGSAYIGLENEDMLTTGQDDVSVVVALINKM